VTAGDGVAPGSNPLAEEILCGRLIEQPADRGEAHDLGFRPAYMSQRRTRVLYEIVDAHVGDDPDFIGICEAVRRRGESGLDLSYVQRVREAWEQYPSGLRELCNTLRECADRRALRLHAQQLTVVSRDPTADYRTEALHLVDHVIATIAGDTDDLRSMRDVLIDRAAFHAARKPGTFDGIRTGLHELDRLIDGLPRGEVAVAAARTSRGKTVFALQVALEAVHQGHHVLFASVEMTRDQIADRAFAHEARIDLRLVRTSDLSAEDRNELHAVAARFPESLYLFSKPGMTSEDVDLVARRRHRQRPLDLVVVDYVQRLADLGAPGEPRTYVVGRVMGRLTAIAQRCHAAVLVLAQCGRAADTHEPTLADLKDSASLENDPDVVMFLHPNEEAGRDATDLIVAKARHGQCGRATVMFEKPIVRFVERRP
jgi:replicative DNA helicase